MGYVAMLLNSCCICHTVLRMLKIQKLLIHTAIVANYGNKNYGLLG